jgi:protease I
MSVPANVMHLPRTRVAVLVEEEFEDAELLGPVEALRRAGTEVVIVGPVAGGAYQGRQGASVAADMPAARVRVKDLAGLVIPGGHAPDRMRLRHAMVDLARDATASDKVVAAIGRGPQLLISANALRSRTLTCWPSIAVDVKNAGGLYVDKPVVVDRNLVTSRKVDDVPVFCEALLGALRAARSST